MNGNSSATPPLVLMTMAALLLLTANAVAQGSVAPSASLPWDTAFVDRNGSSPVHFVAHYVDGHGTTHRLEEWRVGEAHLRRKTDDRIDLHADAAGNTLPGQPPAYLWQILDLQTHVANRVSTAGMLHLGMLYSYYAMAHVLTRPAGTFTVQRSEQPASPVQASAPPAKAPPPACTWWQMDAPGQPATRVCWSERYGLPFQTWSRTHNAWKQTFAVERIDTHPLAPGTFKVNTTGFQVRNVDEIESED